MTKLFCPACGQPLVRKETPPSSSLVSDESEHWWCENNVHDCRVSGTFFKVHHPFRGVDSKPGLDFWSVTWVK